MRSGIVLGALGLAAGAVSLALSFFSPLAAGLFGLTAGFIAFITGAVIYKAPKQGGDSASEDSAHGSTNSAD